MKRVFLVLLAICLLVVMTTGSAFALQGSIKNTKHDLSVNSTTTGPKSTEDEICVFCHTPHNARVAVPLWNREQSGGGTPTSYSTYTSATIQGTRDTINGSSANISVLCLSCHDGALSLGAVVNNYPSATDPAGWSGAGVDAGTGKLTSRAKLGVDLTNDHPVSITYDDRSVASGGPGDLIVKASLPASIQLFGATNDRVECASCHAVHGGTNAEPFLRMSNQNSALCLACHKK
jgi:predicted CXXCH cytochrome family protein